MKTAFNRLMIDNTFWGYGGDMASYFSS